MSNEDLFVATVEKLRAEWFGIMLTVGFNRDFLRRDRSYQCVVTDRSLFDEIFRCGNTASFLWVLFTDGAPIPPPPSFGSTNNWPIIDSVTRASQPNSLVLYFFELGGSLPEHVFIVAEINGNYYLMQSFIGTYTFSARHAFMRIDNINFFMHMITVFQMYCDKGFTEADMAVSEHWPRVAKLFSVYTNIDLARFNSSTEDMRIPSAPARMRLTRTTVPAHAVAARMEGIIDRICLGLQQTRAVPSATVNYDVFLYNLSATQDDVFTTADAKNVALFKKKLVHSAGFNAYKYDASIIDFRVAELEASAYGYFEFQFTIGVAQERLIRQELSNAFGCMF